MNPTIDILSHTSRTGRYVSDEPLALEMAQAGLLHDHGPQALAGGMHYLTMTALGRSTLVAHKATLPKPKPLTRSQRRYREYLSISESYRGFGDFLRANPRA